MTTFERFERDVPRLMDELAPSRLPDYVDDMLRTTARTPQRPAWRTLERWLPMGVIAQTSTLPRVPWRPIALVALLIIGVIAAGLAVAGSQQPAIPAPFGAADNGVLMYRAPDGTIHSLDPDTGEVATIAAASAGLGDPFPSRDGRRVAYLSHEPVAAPIVVTGIDGADPVPLVGEYYLVSSVDWSPDATELAIVSSVRGIPSITVLQADGSGALTLPLGREIDQMWYLPDGRLAFMAAELGRACRLDVPTEMRNCDLFTVNTDGSGFDLGRTPRRATTGSDSIRRPTGRSSCTFCGPMARRADSMSWMS